MYMSDRAPPNRMCPGNNGQSNVRPAKMHTMAAVNRGIGGSNATDDGIDDSLLDVFRVFLIRV